MILLLLCILTLLLPGCSRAAEVYGDEAVDCPTGCANAERWCRDVFVPAGPLAGQINATDCVANDRFRCVCNDVDEASITVIVGFANGKCTWDGQFEDSPTGGNCTTNTAMCPVNCAAIDTRGCLSNSCKESHVELDNETTIFQYNFTCSTCQGRVYTITGNETSCVKDFSDPPARCDPATTCNGHGCCTVPNAAGESTCRCHRSPDLGFWAEPSCRECVQGYDSSKGRLCGNPTPIIQVILSNISTTWTMVLPNMAVLFLFVVVGLARSLWDSDATFDLTALRRANLSTVHCAQRDKTSRFHSKYIPRRPAKSRCFMNTNHHTQQSRGVPAY